MKSETLLGIVGMGILIFFSINRMRDQSLVLYAHQHPQNSLVQQTNANTGNNSETNNIPK
jgi:hypothetical protein